MIKILVISDTHNDDYWLKYFKFSDYDYILHAGDHLLDHARMQAITPYFVDGNNDWGSQNFVEVKIDQYRFGITHGHEYMSWLLSIDKMLNKLADLANQKHCDVLIFGHTHIPCSQYFGKTLILNPGSMHHSRHNGKRCYSIIIIDDSHRLTIENYEIER